VLAILTSKDCGQTDGSESAKFGDKGQEGIQKPRLSRQFHFFVQTTSGSLFL